MTLTRLPDFPQHPEDGFEIKADLDDGDGYVIWTYEEAFNQWNSQIYYSPLTGFVYTDQVKTREPHDTIKTQKDVNHALHEGLTRRVQVLEQAVRQLQDIELLRGQA